MKFEIKNRFTETVQFTTKIKDSGEYSLNLGIAIKIAIGSSADLDGANLAGANLAGANLTCANLTRVDLAGAYLDGANLTRANLAGANLAGANLAGANLAGANLADANLICANLTRVDLAGANLTCADLTRANLTCTNLTRVDLTRADLTCANLAGAKYSAGIPLTKQPIFILGLRWNVMILDTHIKIGCELHATNEWEEFDDGKINNMDFCALRFWRKYKELILTTAKLHQTIKN